MVKMKYDAPCSIRVADTATNKVTRWLFNAYVTKQTDFNK